MVKVDEAVDRARRRARERAAARQMMALNRGDYVKWLEQHFPRVASKPLGERHQRLWQWFEGLEAGKPLPPRLEVWPRGGAKSSTGELGCAFVGTRLSRKFVLYVSETQEQADKHIATVAGLLDDLGIGAAINKQGRSKGWRRNQLRASNGFNVAAFGLDTDVRGVKLDEFRPDLFIFDDIDGRQDTPKTTKKKEDIITQTLLPAGSTDAAILFLQNLIIEDGIVSRIVEGRADYLLSAEIRGPEPAIVDLVVEDDQLANGRAYKRIVSGTPTWEGQDLEICQRQIIEWGWTAFKRESQHQVHGADGLFFDTGALRYCDPGELPSTLRLTRAWDLAATQGGGDFSAGALLGRDTGSGKVFILDVKRHQYASNDVRGLIARCLENDKRGEIYAADTVDEQSGAFVRSGNLVYRFRVDRTPKLHIPQDPGQAGKAQAESFRDGFGSVIKTAPVSGRKSVRARNFQEAVNNGDVVIVRGEWNHAFVEELRKFREDEQHDWDDQVDAATDAFNDLRGDTLADHFDRFL